MPTVTAPMDFLDRLPAFAKARVLVIGDVMLDRYVSGHIERISPEAPVPVLRHDATRQMLGGAGNVAANIAALGGKVDLVCLIGQDADGEAVRAVLAEWGVNASGLVASAERPTSVKTRFLAQGQQVLRHDWERTEPVSLAEQTGLLDAFAARLEAADIVVLSDYGKGTALPPMAPAVIAAARHAGKRVLVDPKGRDFTVYRGASVITPNRRELSEATDIAVHDDASVEAAGAYLIETCQLEAVLATRSEDGLSVLRDGAPPIHIPTEAQEVFDVSGAGDTVVAALALGLAAGLDWGEAANLANAAAGVVVGKRGTAQVTPDELYAARRRPPPAESLVAAPDEAARRVAAWQRSGLKVGFTNGCFDLIHPGHVALLAYARSHCDRLVVGLNDDASVTRLKGPSRPVNPLAARAEVMAALKPVDLVTAFAEDTPLALIEALKPDVLVKGADYTVATVVGADVVQANGGRVLLAPLVEGQSTTAIIAQLTETA
ncbi:MAG: bifunctional D-glycero-beta-D-manno-heptose-7-phosphate kinase/D-glycero-beta-D-manno-heptose 1-phosphate adenylyltransferase HldE [Alphaproteobacteria bacterium]|nr:bifunctional D-glycero-beta-D-manno-heptose-7-phosphate kinase/D-glycero-beta-D-manno-heptose 1-phosphate adenylyltransferase HldE [Alphaproteobacteria bacterium]MCB9931136.1 bifunctional D-glycero-beta-D-manno-heptose-7-phosphate kinase/D-glycero-beta-D-manno-heptose 1-phosphate adenylyltransferase HldE [Alphaproteobacteria bacterium]